jgi:hypothetical protein
MKKFKDRYVLGVGYPWSFRLSGLLNLYVARQGLVKSRLDVPSIFVENFEAPKYRLILERVQRKDKK